MNTKDLTRVLAGAKLIGEYFVKSNGPYVAERTSRALYHAAEVLKSLAHMTRPNRAEGESKDSSSSSGTSSGDNKIGHDAIFTKIEIPPVDPFGFTAEAIGTSALLEEEKPTTKIGRERKVPSTQMQRVVGFGSLAAAIGMGTVSENIGNFLSGSKPSQRISDANAERLAEALCRLRGAALKLGQMLSIQDSDGLLPPSLAKALERVRQSADYMPESQLREQMRGQLGENWEEKFQSFTMTPLAAASIGQVHKAALHDGTLVAVKVQYPGVADSISSDLNNLKLLVSATNLLPPGLYIDEIIRVARDELLEECDYTLELQNQIRYRDFVSKDSMLSVRAYVPLTHASLSTTKILTSEFVMGIPIDKATAYSQSTRNAIARTMLYMTIQELFVYRFMQTDPNFSNFLYDNEKQRINLIDFGAAKSYSKTFVDGYMKLVWAAANKDQTGLIEVSKELGFLTGDETSEMLHAHAEVSIYVFFAISLYLFSFIFLSIPFFLPQPVHSPLLSGWHGCRRAFP